MTLVYMLLMTMTAPGEYNSAGLLQVTLDTCEQYQTAAMQTNDVSVVCVSREKAQDFLDTYNCTDTHLIGKDGEQIYRCKD
jgi:hypothetical protein